MIVLGQVPNIVICL